MSGADLGERVDELLAVVEGNDHEAVSVGFDGVARAAMKASPDQIQAVLPALVPVLARIPIGMGGMLAGLAGTMAEHGTDPAVVVPTLVGRAIEAMELAARFEQAYQAAFGEPPDPENPDLAQPTLQRFVGSATDRGTTEPEAFAQVEAWFCGDQWVRPVLLLSQRQNVRAMLPDRPRMTAAMDAMREHHECAYWLYGLLLVLDDEPLIVLHRATGRGFRVTINGVGSNFQLHTLLAAALIGEESHGMLPGQRPSAVEIAAATDGEELTPPDVIHGRFNLVDAYGSSIWNEGRPADIPTMDGTRVVVLDPPPYPRAWTAGRPYPFMRPTVTVHGPLPASEAARWLAQVRPATRTIFGS
ncbi:MAG: hypothetical protein ACJ73S_03380 [Mycobacteriales bacterium]